MKKIKSILFSIAVAVLLVFGALMPVTIAQAEEKGVIALSKVEGTRGNTVTVDIAIEKNPGIVQAYLYISYDSNVLELTGAENKGILSGFEFVKSNDLTTIPYAMNWDGSLLDANNMQTGVIGSLTFKVKDDAVLGKTEIVLTKDSIFNNYDVNEVDFDLQSGSVSVVCGTHNYGNLIAEVPATCTENGTRAHYVCSVCNQFFDADKEATTQEALVIKALGHAYGAWTVTKAPTTSEGGQLTKVCANDNSHTETHDLPALSESGYTKSEKVKATCVTKGIDTYTYSDSYLDANGNPFSFDVNIGKNAQNHVKADGTTAITATAAKQPTCTVDGNIAYWTCSECKKIFSDATCETEVTNTVVEKLGHTYEGATPAYEWKQTATGYECIASITCARNCKEEGAAITETITATSTVKTPATCTVMGYTTYTATFQNKLFTAQTKDMQDIECIAHQFAPVATNAWTWTEIKDGERVTGYSAATLTLVCKLDGSKNGHTETKNATVTTQTATQTCTQANDITFIATFAPTDTVNYNGAPFTDEKTVNGVVKGHTFVPTVIWNDDYTAMISLLCSACNQEDGYSVAAQAAIVTSETTKEPTCTKTGTKVYTASLVYSDTYTAEKTYTATNTKTEILPALGHTYGEPTAWEWKKDNNNVIATATFTCTKADCDASDKGAQKLTANGTIVEDNALTYAPTCTQKGQNSYTATVSFNETNYTTPTANYYKDEVAALGHDFVPTAESYVWSEDGKTCSASVTCSRCTETFTDTATITDAVKTPATCTVKGWTTYTATFSKTYNGKTVFTEQTKDVQDIQALGHTYEGQTATYTWSEDGTTCSANITCARNCAEEGATIAENATVTSVVKTPATCMVMGWTTYTATFQNELFAEQTNDVQNIAIDENAHKLGAWLAEDENNHSQLCEYNSAHKVTAAHQFNAQNVCTDCKYYKVTESVSEEGKLSIGQVGDSIKNSGVDFIGAFTTVAGNASAELSVTVETNFAVTFNASAIDTVAQMNNALLKIGIGDDAKKAEVKQEANLVTVKAVIDISLGSSSVSFGDGKVTITYPVDATDLGARQTVVVYYVDDYGNKAVMVTTYENGVVSFETNHFSTYVIAYEYDCVLGTAAHEFGAWSKNATRHTRTCSVCATVQSGAHRMTETVDKQATCTENGSKTVYCTVCRYQGVETIQALGHNYGEGSISKQATCTEEGVIAYTCSVCGDSKTEVIPVKAHTEEIDAAKAATCTEKGLTEGKHCSVCGKVLEAQKEVAALGHTEVIDKAVAPTCVEEGLTEGKHCSVCGEVIVKPEKVSPTGQHTFDNDKDATCNVCGFVREVPESGLPVGAIIAIVLGGVAVAGGVVAVVVLVIRKKNNK